MSQIKRIGIDTSKAVFTRHGVDQAGQPVLRTNLRRAQMIPYFKNLPPTEIAMEACGLARKPPSNRVVPSSWSSPVPNAGPWLGHRPAGCEVCREVPCCDESSALEDN